MSKRKKIFSILIIFVISSLIWEYFLFTKYSEKDDDKTHSGYDEILLDFGNSNILNINIPTSECDNTGYTSLIDLGDEPIVVTDLEKVVFEDNGNQNCPPSVYRVNYIKDDRILGGIFKWDNPFPLEKFNSNGNEYEWLGRSFNELDDGSTKEVGYVLQRTPTVNVNGYQAFRIYSYERTHLGEVNKEEIDIFKDTSYSTYCVFDLSKISSKIGGYLEFEGVSEFANSYTDYCEILKDSKDFKIQVKK